MSETEKVFERWTRLILMIAIAVSIVFLGIFAMLGLRLNSEFSCGIDTNGPSINAELQNHTHPLDLSNDAILQEFELNATQYLSHEFCFTIYCVNSDGAAVNVINGNEDVLSTEFVIQGAGRYCSNIENVTDHQYLGLNCPTCINPANQCFVQEVIAGDQKIHVQRENNSFSSANNEIMSYTLNSRKDCKDLTRWFLWAYLWTMLGLFFMVLILIGFRRFEKFIFEEVKI